VGHAVDLYIGLYAYMYVLYTVFKNQTFYISENQGRCWRTLTIGVHGLLKLR